MNILDEANKIVNERSEEKERAYGSFSEGMKRAASIASGMTGKNISADDMFACMVALKFSRQSFNHKTDNLLDAVAYIGAWNNFIEEELSTTFPKKAKEDNSYVPQNPEDLADFLAEANQHFSPIQQVKENEFKSKFEEEVFGDDKAKNWSSVSPAQAFRELEEKLQIMTDSIIAIHNNMTEVTKEVKMNTVYAKYLAENIDKTIDYAEYLAEHLNKLKTKMEQNGHRIDVDAGDAGPG